MPKSAAKPFRAIFLFTSFALYAAGFSMISKAEKAESIYEASMQLAQETSNPPRESKLRQDIFAILGKTAPMVSEDDRWKLTRAVIKYSAAHGHDPYLLLAVIETESAYRQDAISNKGAVGYMQVRPFVARAIASEVELSPDDAESALAEMDTNLRLGSYYLSKMKKRFGDLDLALVAYNLGPSKLREFLNSGKKPDMKYTRKVLSSKKRILKLSPMASAGKNAA